MLRFLELLDSKWHSSASPDEISGLVGYLRLYWHWRGHARELIAASAFLHTPQQLQYVRAIFGGKERPIAHEDRSIIYHPGEGW